MALARAIFLDVRLASLNTFGHNGAIRPAMLLDNGFATATPSIATAPSSIPAVTDSDIHSSRTDTNPNLRERRKSSK